MRPIDHATLAILATASLTLVSCGDSPSKSALAKVIDEHNLETYDPICWMVERKPAQLPLTIGLTQSPAQDPILDGLGRSGLITAKIGKQGMFGAEWTIALTDAGSSAGVWDENKGFCIGQRRVHEVIRWTEPTQGRTATYIEVTYTWQLEDRPKWVTPEMFPGVEGMVEPVESSITLVKTSDGWRPD
ncbi:MAG: hypothetical protein CVV17_10350 [Gammaproteobacteria bacterium HGW-Gammaproteobacteria-7]|nr:MAG: hypothetical protein CVV17_10350 [Gammaproteobacteria bacterium HGW-Gammaproteobacteria-7]